MTNHKKGSTKAFFIIIILLVILAFGVYLYFDTKLVVVAPNTSQPTSISGMQKYTDVEFGFSFWYPADWQVVPVIDPPFGANIKVGTIMTRLGVGPVGDPVPAILVEEVHSPTMMITDTGGAGPIGPVSYFFDSTKHQWMTAGLAGINGTPEATTTANISKKTMGGLYMLSGTSRFDTAIIPLTAGQIGSGNFVVVSDGGGSDAAVLEKTVSATGMNSSSVPINIDQQVQTIENEKDTLASEVNK